MSVDRLARLQRTVRAREWQSRALLALPLLVGIGACAWRWLSIGAASVLAALTLALLSVRLWTAMRRIDRRWIARELNRLCPELQDSTELLDVDGTALSPVTRLQQARARSILETLSLPELRRPWPQRQLGLAWVLGSVMLIAAGCWPPAIPPAPPPNAASRLAVGTAAAAEVQITQVQLEIAAPPYTGLPERTESALATRVAEGSTLHWTLRLQPEPTAVQLHFHDGTRLPLAATPAGWQGTRTIDRSTDYRIEIDPGLMLADDRLQRLQVIADEAPQVRVLAPERSLTLHRG